MYRKILTLLRKSTLISFLLVMSCAIHLSASISVVQTKANHSMAPVGSQVDMIYFQLKATNGNTSFSSVTFANDSIALPYGNGISAVALYRDNGTGAFDPTTSQLIKTLSFSTLSQAAITLDGFTEQFSSGDVKAYFIVYTMDNDAANIGETTNLTLKTIQDSSVSLAGQTTDVDVLMSGFSSVIVRGIAPKLVVPGQTTVPMLRLSIKVQGEDVSTMKIDLKNEGRNFVTTAGGTNGVTKAYLYKDTVNGVFDPEFVIPTNDPNQNLIKVINSGEFTSSSEAIFSLTSSDNLNFPTGVTVNLFVVYDIGESFSVSSDTQVYAQQTSLTGKGSISNLNMVYDTDLPIESESAYVAGLAYSSLAKMSTSGHFGIGTVVPIFQFVLSAYQASMNLQTITLDNNGTVPYITDPDGVDGVTKISIYNDNGNGTFDGVGSQDSLVGSLSLGTVNSITGLQNQKTRAVVPIRKSDGSALRLLPYGGTSAGGYPQDNTALFFVVYTIGGSITGGTTTSGNAEVSVTAALETAKSSTTLDDGSGKIVSQNINLSGTLPANASPVAKVTLLNTNVYIKDIFSIAPSPNSVIQGQVKVPMLYFQLDSQIKFPSASIVIKNEKSTFINNNTGVSKVWIYKDTNASGTYDSSDTFISSNDSMSDTTYVNLNGVRIDQGPDNRYLVLYDIGQNASLSSVSSVGSSNIRAQLNNVVATSLIIGGELPNPQKAAAISVAPKGVVIDLDDPNVSTILDNTPTFSATYRITNNSTSPITVTDIIPRFYFGTLFGADVSYDYSAKPGLKRPPFVVSPSITVEVIFDVNAYSNATNGTIIMDGYAAYTTSSGQEAVLSRYNNGGSWSSAVSTPRQFVVSKTPTQYSWSIPSYISSMQVVSGGINKSFSNYGAVQSNSALNIFLKNNGSTVDDTSIKVKLNGTSILLGAGSSSTAPYFTYDKSTGTLYISNLGTADGNLEITAKDLEGKALDTANIFFSISSVVRIEDPFFFPNPYHFGSVLKLGFNLTQPATVQVYVYNYLGSEVYHGQITSLVVGYVSRTMGDLAAALSSGMYICKLIATDTNGNESRAVTRMAVY